MKIVVTGGAGFIGSNFVRYLLTKYETYRVVVLDKLTYAGSLDNLDDWVGNRRLEFCRADICNARRVSELFSSKPDAVVHFAAESHVDRSILGAARFVRTNVLGTQVLLEAANQLGISRFIYVSTDEVYGSADAESEFSEESPLAPNSPYAASKAGGELTARAYLKTYGFPVIITRCSNNYGPHQYPEKLIPLAISRALAGEDIPVYGDGLHQRDWIYVGDHCSALDVILHRGTDAAVYNISSGKRYSNIEIVRRILKRLGKPESSVSFVRDRPGHDRCYAVDSGKLRRELGWGPAVDLEQGLKETIRWYRANESWRRRRLQRRYRAYYKAQYEHREGTLARAMAPVGGERCASS